MKEWGPVIIATVLGGLMTIWVAAWLAILIGVFVGICVHLAVIDPDEE